MSRATSSCIRGNSSGMTSKLSSSCTCIIIFDRRPRLRISRSMSTIARFMMSAAEPCMGALMALRSAYPRTTGFFELMSGR